MKLFHKESKQKKETRSLPMGKKSRTIPTSLSVKNAVHGSWKSKHG